MRVLRYIRVDCKSLSLIKLIKRPPILSEFKTNPDIVILMDYKAKTYQEKFKTCDMRNRLMAYLLIISSSWKITRKSEYP